MVRTPGRSSGTGNSQKLWYTVLCSIIVCLVAERLLGGRGSGALVPAGRRLASESCDLAARNARETVYKRQMAAAVAFLDAVQGKMTNALFWDVMGPLYTCDPTERIGGQGDGGKWICDRDVLLAHDDCVVFSLGSWGDTSFEQAILDHSPNCVVHTFDPTLTPEAKARVEAVQGIVFHPIGICSDKQLAAADAAGNFDALRTSFKITGEANFISLRRAMQEYSIKWVDVLKIDIDGYEWPVFYDLLSGNDTIPITQILIELHPWYLNNHEEGSTFAGERNVAMEAFFRGMWRHNYRVFMNEPNFHSEHPSDFIEYSFVKVTDDGRIWNGHTAKP